MSCIQAARNSYSQGNGHLHAESDELCNPADRKKCGVSKHTIFFITFLMAESAKGKRGRGVQDYVSL